MAFNKSKKGQAAMEFLMTYGWAILVVLVAIAALAYFGVTNINTPLVERTYFGPKLSNIANAYVTSDGKIEFAIKNTIGQTINITDIKEINTDECEPISNIQITKDTNQLTLPIILENNKQIKIELTCQKLINTNNKKINTELSIEYINTETNLPGAESGSIVAKIN